MSCSKAMSTTHPHPVRCSHPHPSPSPFTLTLDLTVALTFVSATLSCDPLSSCFSFVAANKQLPWKCVPVQIHRLAMMQMSGTAYWERIHGKLVEFHVEMSTRNARERKTVKQSPERISRWASSRSRIQKDCRKELIFVLR